MTLVLINDNQLLIHNITIFGVTSPRLPYVIVFFCVFKFLSAAYQVDGTLFLMSTFFVLYSLSWHPSLVVHFYNMTIQFYPNDLNIISFKACFRHIRFGN